MKTDTKNSQNNNNESENTIYLLEEWSKGNLQVESQLIEALYPHIHQIAHKQFKSQKAASLQTTEIVNEAFIKIRKQKSLVFKSKQHFFAIATKVIRNVVVNHFRSESRLKRGGQEDYITLDRVAEILDSENSTVIDWLMIDRLLNDLEKIDAEAAQVVEYKIFGGSTIPEMAEMMSVSESTISRNWKFARLWLLSQIK